MKLTVEISSIENSNLHIQIKNLNIRTTHSKTHAKSRDFPIAQIHLQVFPFEASPPRGGLGAEGHLDSDWQTFEISETCVWHLSRR